MTAEHGPPPGIHVQGLTKTYRKPDGDLFQAVNHASFSAQPGRIFGLLGPNGAGKTTTLRMLATLIEPSDGTATVGGYGLREEPHEVRKRIGFLTGSTGVYPRLSCREVVRYFGRLHGLSDADLEPRIDAVFQDLGITDFQNKRCGDLSTGMKQKVSIARAIVHDPPVLILDEPTTGLDVLASRSLVDFIYASKEQGKCLLFSTHIMSEAERLCDSMAIIHRGRIVAQGTMDELRRETGKEMVEDVFLSVLARSDEAPAGPEEGAVEVRP